MKNIYRGDISNDIILTVRIKEIDSLLVNLDGPNRNELEFYSILKKKII